MARSSPGHVAAPSGSVIGGFSGIVPHQENGQPWWGTIMLTQSEIRANVTNKIVTALQSGAVPFWRQTWAKSEHSGSPTSAVSGKPYQGINRVLLSIQGHQSK